MVRGGCRTPPSPPLFPPSPSVLLRVRAGRTQTGPRVTLEGSPSPPRALGVPGLP